jgi:hypothetical protein
LAALVEDDLLVEGVAQALRDAAVHLPVDDLWVQNAAAVVDDDVLEDACDAGLDVDLDRRNVDTVGVRVGRGMEVVGRFQARLQTLREGEGRRR